MSPDTLQIRDALRYQCDVREIVANQGRLHGHAEQMHAIALDHDVPVGECVRWISSPEFSLEIADWVHHCIWYADFQRTLCQP